jgi:hypothetical protein
MRHSTSTLLLLASLSLLAVKCKDSISGPNLPPDNHEKVTITQGVWGNVWFWQGNFMPTTDNSSHGTITPVVREVFVYEPTTLDSVVIANHGNGGLFYDSILTRQITKLKSDNTGFFQVELPPGKYSFFVKEDSLYYANEGDSEGDLQAASVAVNSVTKRQIDINYKAAY